MRLLFACLFMLTVVAAPVIVPVAATVAKAHDIKHGALIVDHPIMHPPLGRPDMTVGYMRLLNKGEAADRLVSVSAAIADRIEIHTNMMDGDIMRMRRLDGVDIPAGAVIAFEPGSFHLMIFGLKERLVTGEEISVTLTFDRAGEIVVPFWVEPRQTRPDKPAMPHHDGTAPPPEGGDDMHQGHEGHR